MSFYYEPGSCQVHLRLSGFVFLNLSLGFALLLTPEPLVWFFGGQISCLPVMSPPRPPIDFSQTGSCLCLAPPASSIWAPNKERKRFEISKDFLMVEGWSELLEQQAWSSEAFEAAQDLFNVWTLVQVLVSSLRTLKACLLLNLSWHQSHNLVELALLDLFCSGVRVKQI